MREKLTLLLLCLVWRHAVAAPLESATTLAQSALLGIQYAARNGQLNGRTSRESLRCIESLKATSLLPVFEKAIAENWTTSEIAEVERFLATPVGKKYIKASYAYVANHAGVAPPEPAPKFDANEAAEFQRFQRTPGGQQLTVRNEFASEKSRREIQSNVVAKVRSCGVGM